MNLYHYIIHIVDRVDCYFLLCSTWVVVMLIMHARSWVVGKKNLPPTYLDTFDIW